MAKIGSAKRAARSRKATACSVGAWAWCTLSICAGSRGDRGEIEGRSRQSRGDVSQGTRARYLLVRDSLLVSTAIRGSLCWHSMWHSVALHGSHLRRDALKVTRLRQREAALLELPLEVPHAEPVRERHEDLQGLLREAAARAAAVARRRVGRRSARDQRPLDRLHLLSISPRSPLGRLHLILEHLRGSRTQSPRALNLLSEHLQLRLALCRRLEFTHRDETRALG